MTISKQDLYDHHLFEEILKHSNDGINVVDKDGIVVYANKVSADYANTRTEFMLNKHITQFYNEAVLLRVLIDKQAVLDQKIHYVGKKKYVVNAYPLYRGKDFIGAYSIFKDIRDIEELNKKIGYLELHIAINKPEKDILNIIGNNSSLAKVLLQAKRTVGALGGPRHSIITGESGTGKTMLANLIYNYAKQVGVINIEAPFIEINCAQFTNPDIAAVEIFGSEAGAYTGARQKKGLFEQANGGILFLDEAHALEQYQNLLLKVIETGTIRRIGGNKEVKVDVIIIAASTRNLKMNLLPELYQRLAQYEIYVPSLVERDLEEKELLFQHFVNLYEKAVYDIHKIKYSVKFSNEAKQQLLIAKYPRNIRQFRDVINFSIDAASPLISEINQKESITTIVDMKHIPFASLDDIEEESELTNNQNHTMSKLVKNLIIQLRRDGLGPRKISHILKEKGYFIEYYQVAYFLKKNRDNKDTKELI